MVSVLINARESRTTRETNLNLKNSQAHLVLTAVLCRRGETILSLVGIVGVDQEISIAEKIVTILKLFDDN